MAQSPTYPGYSHTYSNANYIGDSLRGTIKMAPTQTVGNMFYEAGHIRLKLVGDENSSTVEMVFEPENDITVRELTQLMLLVTIVAHGVLTARKDVMEFVRVQKLERHFKFTQVV